jgi:formylglycine-generating enzyme required for sulfatase activity
MPVNQDLTLYARWVPQITGMVWVPRGSFLMGDSGVSGSPAIYHSYPVRRITLDGFYIGIHPVTQELYENVMSSEGSSFGVSVDPSQFKANKPTRPVERVSWFDAVAFSNSLSQRHALDKVYTIAVTEKTNTIVAGGYKLTTIVDANITPGWTKNGFRLPTEAEWEYAARSGNGSPGGYIYAGSNTATDVAWFTTNSGSQPHPVGTLAPNSIGLFDMSGNVSEWCWDWLGAYKDLPNPAVNPRGPTSGDQRIRRGGAWSNAVGNVRVVVRNSAVPRSADWTIGFRVVRGATPADIY